MPLEREVLRAAGRIAIAGLVKQGLGSNAIINVLRSIGLSYQRTVMLTDVREFSGLMKLENRVLRLARDALFPQWAMVETPLRRLRKYRVFGRAVVLNKTTGEREDVMISFYTDTRASKQQWEQDYTMEFPETVSGEEQVLEGMDVVSVEHQEGFDY